MDCVFCDLNEKYVIRQTKNTVTILSNPYLIEGHSLVMPRAHVERLSELSQKIRHKLIDEAMIVEELLMQRLGSPGCDLRQNYRPFLPLSRLKVNHLHFHVIPRCPEDELHQKSGVYERRIFKDLNLDLAESLISKLK